jgi:hypothetical protein
MPCTTNVLHSISRAIAEFDMESENMVWYLPNVTLLKPNKLFISIRIHQKHRRFKTVCFVMFVLNCLEELMKLGFTLRPIACCQTCRARKWMQNVKQITTTYTGTVQSFIMTSTFSNTWVRDFSPRKGLWVRRIQVAIYTREFGAAQLSVDLD